MQFYTPGQKIRDFNFLVDFRSIFGPFWAKNFFFSKTPFLTVFKHCETFSNTFSYPKMDVLKVVLHTEPLFRKRPIEPKWLLKSVPFQNFVKNMCYDAHFILNKVFYLGTKKKRLLHTPNRLRKRPKKVHATQKNGFFCPPLVSSHFQASVV